MEDNISADGNGRTVIRMAEAEKQQDGSRTYGKYENKEVTALTEKLHQAFEPEERAKLATELQQKILDDDGFFFVSHLNMGIVTKSNVKGMAAHPCDYYEITADLDVE